MQDAKSLLIKTVGILLTCAAVLALCTPVIAAPAYPSRPVRLIIPVAPGGAVDMVGRLMAAKLSERLDVQVLPENHGGAGAIIGTEIASKSEPDGYTLLWISNTYVIQPSLQQKLPYDPLKSFTPVARVVSGSQALTVHPSVPANSVKELIALAKQKPGQLLFVNSGVGSIAHMATELFKSMADIDFKILQFKGGGPALVDLLGGHSHASIGSVMGALPQVKSGKLRALGTSGVRRSVVLPDVPTIAEAGVPGFSSSSWYGILAPAGTPAPIIERLNREIKAVLTLDELKKKILTDGMEVDYLGPTEFGPYIADEIAKWGGIVQKANIKIE